MDVGGTAPLVRNVGTRWKISGRIHSRAALPPGVQPLVPIEQGAWWASELAWAL